MTFDADQALLRAMFDAAVAAADPGRCLPPPFAGPPPRGAPWWSVPEKPAVPWPRPWKTTGRVPSKGWW